MKILRPLALAALAGLSACHEDPEVVTVVVNSLSNGLTVRADGGSKPLSGVGTPGDGGTIEVTAFGPLAVGTASTGPVTPLSPAVPSAGATAASATGETAASGNLLIPSLTTTSDAIYAATNGDIVVNGILQAGNNGGGQFNITLNAPNGTVFVVGTVRTASADGTLDGDDAGTISINAARVVVSGILDASGEANTGGAGGDGGAISLDSDAGTLVLQTSGSLTSAGGTGTTAGGIGGNVSLDASSGLYVFSTLTMSGGDASGAGVTPVGGAAGDLALAGNASVDVAATLTLRGGSVTSSVDGGTGGAGGDVVCDSVVHVRIFGSIDQRGGDVTASAIVVGTITAGAGGHLRLGQAGGVLSADLGVGTFSTSGGSGGGNAGLIRLESDSGAISVASDLVARGGPGVGPNTDHAGDGGAVTIQNDSDLTGAGTGHVGFHPITLLMEGSIDSSGGAGGGTPRGNGGVGGAITIEGGGHLTLAGQLNSSGGGASGNAGAIIVRTSADSGTPTGNIVLSGTIQAQGQNSENVAGNGGSLTVLTDFAPGSGHIVSSATINLSGATTTTNDVGGVGGALTMRTAEGDLTVSGTITSRGGGGGATNGGSGGKVILQAGSGGGSILFSAGIDVSGGSSTAVSSAGVAGGAGGDIDMICLHPAGFIALTSGSTLTSNGGSSTGVLIGGSGGATRMLTDGQFVSITATITALGGSATGATGFGGLGGAVQVHTNSTAGGPGGDITLTSGSSINVSGGGGPTAGPARNNAGSGITDGDIDLVAVQFDADGDLTTSGANAPDGGIVINNGAITAGGLAAGDILFDGRDATGAALTGPAPGSITPAPGASGTTFEGQ